MKMLLVWMGMTAVALGCNCDLVVVLPLAEDAGADGGPNTDGGGMNDDAGSDGGSGFADAGCIGGTSTCYSGPANTLGKGVCRGGRQSCGSGAVGPCTGEVLPSTESCNGLDDDCNGIVDDAAVLGTVSCGLGACRASGPACVNGKPSSCLPGDVGVETCGNGMDDDCDGVIDNGCRCTHVARSGSDDAGTGSATAPFATISYAISRAGDGGLGDQVCVASLGPACSILLPSTSVYSEAITMRDGISVFGGFRDPADGGPWTRPPSQIVVQMNGTVVRKGCATVIAATDDRGVYFGHSVTATTSIDGFTLYGASGLDAGPAGSAAVTVEGSTGALINDNLIQGGGTSAPTVPARLTVGVFVDGRNGAATPILSNNAIVGGTGVTSIGVRSLNGAPQIQDSCTAFDSSGRCVDDGCGTGCSTSPARRFIRARPFGALTCPPGPAINATDSYGVLLESSPKATVSRSAVCTSAAPGESAAVRITGNSAGVTIRANQLQSDGSPMGALNTVGVWADSCGGTSPWIVNNSAIRGNGRSPGSRGDGVRAVGDCPMRIDSNQVVSGGQESSANDAYGVYCAKDPVTKLSSRCTVLNNLDIVGSGGGLPPIAAGVRCDDGACARIEGNARISARACQHCFGIILGNTGTYVARNTIEAGCATRLGVGIFSDNSFARIENNVIGGSRWTSQPGGAIACSQGSAVSATNVYGLLAVLAPGPNEIEVSSNDIFAFGTSTACVARAIAFDLALPCTTVPCPLPVSNVSPGPRGIIRNNLLHTGFGAASTSCLKSYAFEEASPGADPRVFENNDLWYAGNSPTALYLNEGTILLGSAAAVNGLTDITVGGVVSVDPRFLNGFNFPSTPISGVGIVVPTEVRLDPKSPLIDAGTSVGAPLLDFYGGVRPQGGAYDIGAHEQ